MFDPESLAEYKEYFGRHTMICGLWIASFCYLVYLQIRIMMARVQKVSGNFASSMVNHEDGLFVDVRSQNLFDQAHIANSVNITAADIKAGRTQRIDAVKDKPIILVGKDKMDGDSFSSACVLQKRGFSRVFTLEGGINQWAMDNLPLTAKR